MAHKVVKHIVVHHVKGIKIEDFYSTEAMGVQCYAKCGGCKCGSCPTGGKDYTLKEERELSLIDKGLKYENEHWVAKYPWIKDPYSLPDNKQAVFGMLKSTERQLSKNKDHAEMYQQHIDDMIQRKVARKLCPSELEEYKGPTYYISHHEVLKPDSQSTPCRIVFNSSAKFKGQTLNECWAKGPNLLNNLLGILVRFRENEIAISGDIRKMYHTVKINIVDQHTHRFLWRNMEVEREPDIYVMTSVSFGDKPAGDIAILALRKTAEMGEGKYPKAAKVINKSTYMDDIIDRVDSVKEAKELTGDIDKLLQPGRFEIKGWSIHGETECLSPLQDKAHFETTVEGNCVNPKTKKKEFDIHQIGTTGDSHKVLGVGWDPTTDSFVFNVGVNFSPKRRKLRTGPDLTIDQIPLEMPLALTKRMILSQVNGIYDPLGLATAVTARAKILLRKLCGTSMKNLDWDRPIPDEFRFEWVNFFRQLLELKDVTFKRCIKPSGVTGEPVLVLFSDGSEDMFGTCAYLRWQIKDGTFVSSLLASKSRLTPLKKITIVKMELNGAVLSKRLEDFITSEGRLQFARIYYIIDSEIVRAMIQKESYGFKTYLAVRVGEIQNHTSPQNWYWIDEKLNIADWITRGKDPVELDPESIWQNGPEFLKLPEEKWLIKQDGLFESLPEESNTVFTIQRSDSLINRIDINRFSSYRRLIRVTARVVAMYKKSPKASFRNVANVCR
eukprot:gene21204-23286_t